MSARATAFSWRVIGAGTLTGPAHALVLLKLGDRADDRGICWPGHERTARDCSLTDKTARAAAKALEELGILLVERRRDTAGRNLSNRYRFNFNWEPPGGWPRHPEDEGEEISPRGENVSPPEEDVSPRGEANTPESNKPQCTKDLSAAAGRGGKKDRGQEPPVRLGVIVKTEEDEALLAGLIATHGDEAVKRAVRNVIAGAIGEDRRRPFPSNIARLLEPKSRKKQPAVPGGLEAIGTPLAIDGSYHNGKHSSDDQIDQSFTAEIERRMRLDPDLAAELTGR